MRAMGLRGAIARPGVQDHDDRATTRRRGRPISCSARSRPTRPNRALGRRPHLRRDLARLRLRRLRHRRVRAHGSSAGACRRRCARDLALDALEQALHARPGSRRPRASQRSRRAIPLDSLHRAPGRRRHRAVRRQASATPTTMPSPRSVIGLYKTEVIRRQARGATSRPSSSRRSRGSTGSTTGGCSSRSATCRRPSSRKPTTEHAARDSSHGGRTHVTSLRRTRGGSRFVRSGMG